MEIEVRVHPRSSRRAVERMPDGSFKVWVSEPPAEGAANEAVCALLAREFDVPKSSVEILRGHKSRLKRVRVPNPHQVK